MTLSSPIEDLFLSSESPRITIRRPADFHVPQNPTTPYSGAYPREAISSHFQISTPVIVTPIETRSTRTTTVQIRPMRRVRRRQGIRSFSHSIRRRLSMATAEETGAEIQMNSPRTLPRSKRIDNTSTAIELECDQFEMMLSGFMNSQNNTTNTDSTDVPCDSWNCAKLREINRLEAIGFAISTLTTDCEDEILKAIDLLEWNIGQMTSETDNIEQILSEIDNEKNRNEKKWEQIELLLNILRSL